jgi:hypothetical protein
MAPHTAAAEEQLENEDREKKPSKLSPKTFLAGFGLLVVPLIAFSLVQYSRYGFSLFLGWDTSTYVWWAQLVYANGPLSQISQQHYVNFYVLVVAGMGLLIGSSSLAERTLPLIVVFPLAFSYFRLTTEFTRNQKFGFLGTFVAGFTINTLRIYSDLHRNLLSFGLCMAVGTVIASQLGKGPLDRTGEMKRAILVWLPMLALAAYTQLETYAVLSLALFLLFLSTRNPKTIVAGNLLVATPVIVALPLMWDYLTSYGSGLSLLGAPQPSTPILAGYSLLYLGGLAIPWTVIGIIDITKKARSGNSIAVFIVYWLVASSALAVVSLGLGLPVVRVLYIIPVPVLAVTGLPPSIRYVSQLSEKVASGGIFLRARRISSKSCLTYTLIALLLVSTFLTSLATTDSFLRPYVTEQSINRLLEAAQVVRQFGYYQPILVMYGSHASDLNGIYRSYFGTKVPSTLAYYGKLQYLFTLPEPALVYQWQFDPPFEQASSLKYRNEILNATGNVSSVSSHAMVIVTGDTYDRPLSELFASRFQIAPGLYIIPPNQLSPSEVDSWRLFAYSDWSFATSILWDNASWSNNPVLTYAAQGPSAQFEANYSIGLAKSWPSMNLTLHFFDMPASYLFPNGSNQTLSPIDIYVDGARVSRHFYADRGPSMLRAALGTMSQGLHQISIRSASLGLGVAVALDYLQVCPETCS